MALHARIQPTFPLALRGTGGITVTTVGGVSTITYDFAGTGVQAILDQAVATATAEAVIATDAAATAAAANLKIAATRGAMANFDPSVAKYVMLTEGVPALLGRMGVFVGTTSDISAIVTRDPQQGVSVAKASDATGASGGFLRVFSGELLSPWFGAKGDNTTDDTAAINATYNFLNGAPGKVRHPAATYLTTDTIFVRHDHIHTRGDGPGATVFRLAPTADFVNLFHHEAANGTGIITGGSYKDFSFYSTDTTYIKIGLQLIDHSNLVVENVTTIFPHWFGGSTGSVGIAEYGRELAKLDGLTIYADKPLYLNGPALGHTGSGIGIDQHCFRNLYLVNKVSSHPLITIESGTLVSQLTFGPYLSLVGGSHGIYFADGINVATSNGITLEKVRFEQGLSSSSYMVSISANTTLQSLTINGGQGADRNGFYLRNVDSVSINNFWYENATGVALDADATVRRIAGKDCFWQAGSTANLAGQRTTFATPADPSTGALAPNFIFDQSANTINTVTIGPVTRGNTLTVAYNFSAALDLFAGKAVIVAGDNTATVTLKGSSHAVTINDDWATVFSTTKDTASKHNVYWDSGTSKYRIQNLLSSPAAVTYGISQFG